MPDGTGAVTLPAEDYAYWKSDLFGHRASARDSVNFFTNCLYSSHLEGKVGYREALAVRTVGQPGVAGHTDTSPNPPGGK